MKRKIATSAAACGLCLGVAAPSVIGPAAAAIDTSVAYDGPEVSSEHDVLGNYAPGADGETLVVVVPGTDDDRSPRIDGLIAGRDSLIVKYPESFWPIISGKSGTMPFLAPTYNESRDIATANTLKVMEALQGSDRMIVYTGFSQGSEALGNAVEQATKDGLLGPGATVILVSDPRGPWGVKSKLSRTPLATGLLSLIGVNNDGARNPGDTGDTKVVHVIVQGDPVAHTQWDPMRPLSSVLVNAAGFITIHSGTGEHTYARLDNLDHVKTLRSEDGNSTYEIYDTYHPLALFNAMIFDALGMPVSQEQLEEWDRAAEAFYPTQEITAENADPSVKVTEVAITPDAPNVTDPTESTNLADDAGAGDTASLTVGKHRLIDPDTGDQAEPQPLIGGTPSNGPRHAAPEADDVPVVDVPTVDVPTDDVPAVDVPVDDVPVDVPTGDAPVDDVPAVDVPVDDAPADEAPVVDEAA